MYITHLVLRKQREASKEATIFYVVGYVLKNQAMVYTVIGCNRM